MVVRERFSACFSRSICLSPLVLPTHPQTMQQVLSCLQDQTPFFNARARVVKASRVANILETR
ncbi:hypothetical protein CY34DRAFT_807747 [Suillus luteus UH-Slu-Lm8-n1]|uniref:Uncharacterized protein n=1 Tax=Suillus luteus UH-Slu-Lm8-n1 TaxID=930992 RepID=A0A0D0API7_9AGAM|nr:hypothetical protein CY34DRAFT_807747 [Suillus luteus UH-Slu-Lm8-n1]